MDEEMSESRPDRRSSDSLRVLSAEVGTSFQADGSCRFFQGNTSVSACVWGPVQPSRREEDPMLATLDIKVSLSSSVSSSVSVSDIEWFIRTTLDHSVLRAVYPRTAIRISIHVHEDDGSVLSCAMNATSLALMDAGVSLSTTPSSITCAFKGSQMILDPMAEESSDFKYSLALANPSGDILACTSESGAVSSNDLFKCMPLVHEAGKSVASFIRLTVKQKLSPYTQE